jgi:probable H4MPT-linked C1 transfer pathway protein
MTGEMVDLFPDRAEGVSRLVEAVVGRLEGAPVRFYAGARGFFDAEGAKRQPAAVASANWMASSALVAARHSTALFLDIGSTTTDVVPVSAGRISARSGDDATRLVSGELVYTGVVRTPLMALIDRAPFAGEWVPLIAEYFATTADVYRLIGTLPDGADQHPAADGGEKTPEASARRVARMIGRDAGSASLADWKQLGMWFGEVQRRRIEDACARVSSREALPQDAPLVVAGVGRFLAGDLARHAGRPCLDFATLLPCEPSVAARASDCAPAVAVAWLAQQERR